MAPWQIKRKKGKNIVVNYPLLVPDILSLFIDNCSLFIEKRGKANLPKNETPSRPPLSSSLPAPKNKNQDVKINNCSLLFFVAFSGLRSPLKVLCPGR
jgi:hypothetical protein